MKQDYQDYERSKKDEKGLTDLEVNESYESINSSLGFWIVMTLDL